MRIINSVLSGAPEKNKRFFGRKVTAYEVGYRGLQKIGESRFCSVYIITYTRFLFC
jgi:hypothetical protein